MGLNIEFTKLADTLEYIQNLYKKRYSYFKMDPI